MSGLEIALIGAAVAWLALLTVVAILLVRQIGLITVRLDRDRPETAPVGDGLAIGEPLPSVLDDLLPQDTERPSFVLILAAVCGPCRQLATDIADLPADSSVIALISGRRELARGLAALLPAFVPAVEDPVAERAVKALQISTTPFVFEVRRGVIVAKSALRGADHLKRFIGEAETLSTSDLGPELEVLSHARR